MNDFTIRPAIADDAVGIAAVQYYGWQQTYRGIIHDSFLDQMSLEKSIERWKKNLAIEVPFRTINVLTDQQNKIIGYASGGKNRDKKFKADGELYALYLMKDYHGGGHGKKLLVNEVLQMKNSGFKSFCLFVLAQNPAVNFYRKFNPDLEDCEKVKIGEHEYDDTGLGWSDINKFSSI